jgi:hypothetical protein
MNWRSGQLYGYVDGNPIRRKDSQGLYSVENFDNDQAELINKALKKVWDILNNPPACCGAKYNNVIVVMKDVLASSDLVIDYDPSLPIGTCGKTNPFSWSLPMKVKIGFSAFGPGCGCLAGTMLHEISHLAGTTDFSSSGILPSAYGIEKDCKVCP